MSKSTRKRTTPKPVVVSRGGVKLRIISGGSASTLQGDVTLRVISGGAVRKPPQRISTKTATHAELRAELKRLRAQHCRLIEIEMRLEVPHGEPGYESYRRACEETRSAQRDLNGLTASILGRPLCSWDDAALLAEAYVAHSQGPYVALVDDCIAGLGALEQRVLACLLTGVLKLSGSSVDMDAAYA